MMKTCTQTVSNTCTTNIARAGLAVLCAMAIASVLFATGCSAAKTAKTTDDVTSVCENAGLTVESLSDVAESDDTIEDGVIAYNSDTTYYVLFYVMDSTESAEELFDEQRSYVEEAYGVDEDSDEDSEEEDGTVSVTTSLEGDNYHTYTISADGTYSAMTQVDSTVLFAECSSDDEEDLTALLEELGY